MDPVGRFGAVFNSFFKGVSDVASSLLANKNADGKPKVLDQLPDVVNTGLQLAGAPELPAADMTVAVGALEDLLVLLSNQSTEAKLKAAEGLAFKLLPGVLTAAAQEVAKNAGDNFVGDLAKGMVKWVSENPSQVTSLATQIATTIFSAIASGGASLVKDIPLLIPTLVSAASGVMKAAGYSPEKLVTDIAVDFLKFIGVQAADAEKAGQIIGTLTLLGADIALAVATQGKHPINPQLVQNAVQQIAVATGIEPDTAAVVAAGAAMAFTLGQNFVGFVLAGNPPETFGGLDKAFSGVKAVVEEAVKLFMGQEGADIGKVLDRLGQLQPLINSFVETITQNATAANPEFATKGWEAVHHELVKLVPGLGLAFDTLGKLAEA